MFIMYWTFNLCANSIQTKLCLQTMMPVVKDVVLSPGMFILGNTLHMYDDYKHTGPGSRTGKKFLSY